MSNTINILNFNLTFYHINQEIKNSSDDIDKKLNDLEVLIDISNTKGWDEVSEKIYDDLILLLKSLSYILKNLDTTTIGNHYNYRYRQYTYGNLLDFLELVLRINNDTISKLDEKQRKIFENFIINELGKKFNSLYPKMLSKQFQEKIRLFEFFKRRADKIEINETLFGLSNKDILTEGVLSNILNLYDSYLNNSYFYHHELEAYHLIKELERLRKSYNNGPFINFLPANSD